jgi:hypothetical protein
MYLIPQRGEQRLELLFSSRLDRQHFQSINHNLSKRSQADLNPYIYKGVGSEISAAARLYQTPRRTNKRAALTKETHCQKGQQLS